MPLALKNVQMVETLLLRFPSLNKKIPANKIFYSASLGEIPPSLNAIFENLGCLQLIYAHRKTGGLKCLLREGEGSHFEWFWKTCRASHFWAFFFFKLGCTSCKAEQLLRGTDLQEKEGKKKMKSMGNCLERTCR